MNDVRYILKKTLKQITVFKMLQELNKAKKKDKKTMCKKTKNNREKEFVLKKRIHKNFWS